ncbi:MAG: hypothetical protein JWM57_4021 [Phycisphaerales bacterium]|nr:hypothetical protein [Phycisphaerales bacterium]
MTKRDGLDVGIRLIGVWQFSNGLEELASKN